MKPISVEPGVYGPNTHVTRADPDPMMLDRRCEACQEDDCRAVARVRWVSPRNGQRSDFVAGRRCVANLASILSTFYPDDPPPEVYVEIPTWRRPDLVAAVPGVTERKAEVWTAERLLISENGPHPGRGRNNHRRYLADMVERAALIETFKDRSRDGISPRLIVRCLDYDRDLAFRFKEFLEATTTGTRT